jgi:hypothetical protein
VRPASSPATASSSAPRRSARPDGAYVGAEALIHLSHRHDARALYFDGACADAGQATLAIARWSSPSEKGPSNRAAMRPDLAITNVHGSVGSRQATTGPW